MSEPINPAEAQKKPWQCPDPRCGYIGTPAIHLLNFASYKHDWSKAQVVNSLDPKKRFPRCWEDQEGV